MNEYEKWSVNGTLERAVSGAFSRNTRVWTGGAVENASYRDEITIMHYDAERVAVS